MAFKPVTSAPSPSIASNSTTAAAPATSMELFENLGRSPTTQPDAPKAEAKEPTTSGDTEEISTQTTEINAPEVESADEALAGDDTAAEADAGNVISVKGNGKLHKFTLDKNDKKLQQTLAYGLVAPKLAEEKKALKKENEALKTQLASSGDAGKYRDASELAEAGFLESSVKEFLGEDLFKKFFNEAVVGRLDYEQADADKKIEIMNARHARKEEEYKWRLERGQKGVEQKKEADSATKQKEAEEATAKIAASVLQTLDFSKVAKEPEAQEALKDDIWYLAMRDIEEWVERHAKAGTPKTPSRKDFEKAFNYRFKRLTGIRHSDKTQVGQTARGQQDAAAKAASANYDKGPKADDVKGLDPLAIFKKMSGRS